MSKPTVFMERFVLKQRLFSEGNQAAYSAHDRLREEEVLLFLVPPATKLTKETDHAVRADIERAFAVAAPSLLPVLDLREIGEYRFLVMPKPKGTNAWSLITQEKKTPKEFTPELALRTADDLIEAAKAAHANDTILGCSPKQVWVDCRRGGAQVQYYWLERVYLGGDEQATPEGGRFKTLGVEGAYFQAPELEKGRAGAQPPADQFFISAVLYGLLTGEVPGGTLDPIHRARKGVPRPLAKAIEKGLSQKPSARHADLDEFRRALYRRPARLRALVPLLLLLLGLWAGHALFLGGAASDDFAFPNEIETRRQAAFEASKPVAMPVPRLEPATAARFAGRYVREEDLDLTLWGQGTFVLVDGSKDAVRRTRGLWWGDPEQDGTLLLMPMEGGSARTEPIKVGVGQERTLWLQRPGDPALIFEKVGWPASDGGATVPLVELDAPLPGRVLNSSKVQVSGRVAIEGTRVVVNGEAVPVPGTHFKTEVSAPGRGKFDVVIVATAPDGFETTLWRDVQIDTGPPRLADVKATLWQVEGVWTLSVTGRGLDDGQLAGVSVNDEPVPSKKDGQFRYERKGADAVAHAFVEVVALDDAGRATRQLLWPEVVVVRADTLASRLDKAEKALADGRTAEAEEHLRGLRAAGGLIEALAPEKVAKLVLGGQIPRITLDDFPQWPQYFTDDGVRKIELTGSVDWFGPDDTLMAGGRPVDVVDKRFKASVQLPGLGRNQVRIQVIRAGEPVKSREIEVWLAGADGEVPVWTGVPVSAAQRAASARYGLPIGRQNTLGMRFVLIPPGAFPRRTSDGRRYEVRLTRPYYLQIDEVTREQFERNGGKSLPKVYEAGSGNLSVAGAKRPALGVSRAEAEAFARRLSSLEGERYWLPTEAEWEYAARAGDAEGETYWTADFAQIKDWANFADKSILDVLPRWPTHRLATTVDDGYAGPWNAGTGKANAFGLKDMLGNAAEWVADAYAPYDVNAAEDPTGPSSRGKSLKRGGSFRSKPTGHGFSKRSPVSPEDEDERDAGFRLRLKVGGR